MDTNDYAKIISSNLRRIMYERNKTQADVSKDLGISKATLSSWMNGTRIPRIKKIDILCHYFNVARHDIMEPYQEPDEYYIDPEAAKMAQEIFDNRQLRLLMNEAMDVSPEDIQTAFNILMALKRKERREDD